MTDLSLAFGGLVLDRASRTVSFRGRKMSISRTECAILEALLEHPGAMVSRMQLRQVLYGTREPGILGNPVQVHIHNLRAKFADGDVIRTLRGAGYAINRSTLLALGSAGEEINVCGAGDYAEGHDGRVDLLDEGTALGKEQRRKQHREQEHREHGDADLEVDAVPRNE